MSLCTKTQGSLPSVECGMKWKRNVPQSRGEVRIHKVPRKTLRFCHRRLELSDSCQKLTLVETGSVSWLTYGTTIGCLLYLRIKMKSLPRTYKVPTFIPAVMILAALCLVLVPIIDHPQMEFLYVFLFLLSGCLAYFLFVYFQCYPKCLQIATLHLQLLLEVAPTTEHH